MAIQQVRGRRLLQWTANRSDADVVLTRFARIVEMIGGRTVYLALLNENTVALQRLLDLCARSQFLPDQIASFPLLLDELRRASLRNGADTRKFARELQVRMAAVRQDEVDLQIEALRHFQRAALRQSTD